MKKEEIAKVEAYLRKTFGTKNLTIRPRPKKDDSAEVYIGDDFVAVARQDRGERVAEHLFVIDDQNS